MLPKARRPTTLLSTNKEKKYQIRFRTALDGEMKFVLLFLLGSDLSFRHGYYQNHFQSTLSL